jgi:hypothetical protein
MVDEPPHEKQLGSIKDVCEIGLSPAAIARLSFYDQSCGGEFISLMVLLCGWLWRQRTWLCRGVVDTWHTHLGEKNTLQRIGMVAQDYKIGNNGMIK